MFGNTFKCSDCDFEWCSGWSHHAGGQFLICRTCGTQILAGGGASCWRPKAGEQLQLFCWLDDKLQPSGVFVSAPATVPISEDGVFMFTDSLPDLTCPHCHATKTVTDHLQAGETCPKCKRGSVQKSPGVCTY
jgi:hypothetical protein